LGDWGDAGEGCHGVGMVVGFSDVAPLGEHLGCVDLTRPWQRREDLRVRVLSESGGDRLVQLFDGVVECGHDLHEGRDRIVYRSAQSFIGGAGWGVTQPGEELSGWPL